MKAIMLNVYRDNIGDCTNGGASGKWDDLYLAHPQGFIEVDDDDERLFKVGTTAFGNPVLEPVHQPSGLLGPMFGGNYGATSDSRFSEAIRMATGRDFYGALPIHDRFETQELYNLLSI